MKEEILVVAGSNGGVAAFSPADGSPLWSAQLAYHCTYPPMELSLAFMDPPETVAVADGGQVWCLDCATGHPVWDWTWEPLPDGEREREKSPVWPVLCPVPGGVFCLVYWESEAERPNERTDIALLTDSGRLVFQKTSISGWPKGVRAQQGRMVFSKVMDWYVWEADMPTVVSHLDDPGSNDETPHSSSPGN